MYTATLKSKTLDKVKRQVKLVVSITDGTDTHDREFTFAFDVSIETVKRAVQDYIDKLDEANQFVDSIPDGATLEYTPQPPTKDEVDEQAWVSNWQNLQAANKLAENGVEVLTPTQLSNLKNTVKDTFKTTYVKHV